MMISERMTPSPGIERSARIRVLRSMVFALALVVSAVASLNLALPDIAGNTGATQTQLQWIVDGYAVVFAGLLLPAGALGDRFGRRRVLVAGLVVFGSAYGVASAAHGADVLIAARAVAGIGAALIMPATLSIITTVFPAEERSRAVGTWAGVAGGGAVLGLLLSGVLLEVASWRWVFAANAIWAAVALVAAAAWAPESRDRAAAAVDPLGALLSAGGLSAVVFATIEGPHRGWGDRLVVGGYVLGALALAAFVRWEATRERPLLDPRLFRHRGMAMGSLSITLQFLGFFGFIFIALQYLQLVLDYSALQAALAMLPLGLTFGATSRQVAPRLVGRFEPSRVSATGLAIGAAGFALLATLGSHSTYGHVLAGLVVLGAGMGLATTPATTAIVGSLPPEQQGVASAVNDTAREVGGSIGIAVLGSLSTAGYHHGVDPHLATLPPDAATKAHDSLAFVVQAADHFGPAGHSFVAIARDASVDGMGAALWVGAAVLAAGAVVTSVHRRRPLPPTDRTGPDATEGRSPDTEVLR